MSKVEEQHRTEEFVKVLDTCTYKGNRMQISKLFLSTLQDLPEPHKTEFIEMAVARQETEEKKAVEKLLRLVIEDPIAREIYKLIDDWQPEGD